MSAFIIVQLVSLIGLLYLTTVMVLSKKPQLKTPFFTINKTFNIIMCLYSIITTADYAVFAGYLPCPGLIVFTGIRYSISALLTATVIAILQMVHLRYETVTNAQLPTGKDSSSKFIIGLCITASLIASPMLFVEFQYDEVSKYYTLHPNSIPFLVFDILETICAGVSLFFSIYFTLRTIVFMRTHKKPWNLYLLHIILSSMFPVVLLQYQAMRLTSYGGNSCEICEEYTNTLRKVASPVTLIVAFSIIGCSREVRKEVCGVFRIFNRGSEKEVNRRSVGVVFSVSRT